jgi:hypothetical protein
MSQAEVDPALEVEVVPLKTRIKINKAKATFTGRSPP